MSRIRTIKPEFPQSESMGRVSRDARLLFIQLWTLADDSGKCRAASRMLASLLFPYDDDAPGLMDGWLAELQAEGCIDLYMHNGSRYLQIRNWLIHQKIDKPSKSKFPDFDDASRVFASVRECSSLDQGPRTSTKDQGSGTKDHVPASPDAAASPPAAAVEPPPVDPVKALFDSGVALLRDSGYPDRSARELVGRWRKTATDDAVLGAIQRCRALSITDPVSWIAAALAPATRRTSPLALQANPNYEAGL